MLRKITIFITILTLLGISNIYSQSKNLIELLKTNNITEQSDFTQIIKTKIEKENISYPKFNLFKKTTETLDIVDSVKFSTSDGNKYKESYIYDSNGEIPYYKTELWDGIKWTNLEQFNIDINLDDNSSSQLKETWNGTQWVKATKTRAVYDLHNNKTYSLTETWDSTQWVESEIIIREYDSADRITFESLDLIELSISITYKYDIDGNLESQESSVYFGELLYRRSITTNSYDSNKILESALLEIFETETWKPSSLVTYGHDSLNNITSELWKKWDVGDSTWVNTNRHIYEFDSNKNRTLHLYDQWNEEDSLWTKKYRYTSSYDLNQLMTLDFCETWDSTKWMNSYEYIYDYKENGNLNFATYFKWENGTTLAANGHFEFTDPRNNGWNFYFTASQIEAVYYNSTITDIENQKTAVTTYSLEQNYPNPFNPSTKINFSLPKSLMVSLKIFNIIGEEVTTLINKTMLVGNYEQVFNASNLPSGLYIYQIKAGTFTESKKMMLIK